MVNGHKYSNANERTGVRNPLPTGKGPKTVWKQRHNQPASPARRPHEPRPWLTMFLPVNCAPPRDAVDEKILSQQRWVTRKNVRKNTNNHRQLAAGVKGKHEPRIHTNSHEFTRIHTNSHECTRMHTNAHELTRRFTQRPRCALPTLASVPHYHELGKTEALCMFHVPRVVYACATDLGEQSCLRVLKAVAAYVPQVCYMYHAGSAGENRWRQYWVRAARLKRNSHAKTRRRQD